MPDLDSLLNPKFIYGIIGVIFLAAAVVSTCAGKTIARYSGWVHRAKEPNEFWQVVVIYYLAAVFGIVIYLRSIFPGPIFHPELWLQLK
jgi:H+/Cl- antiporter ClcA